MQRLERVRLVLEPGLWRMEQHQVQRSDKEGSV